MNTLTHPARFTVPAAHRRVRTGEVRMAVYTAQFALDMAALFGAILLSYSLRFPGSARIDLGVLLLPPLFALLAFLLRCYSLSAMLSAGRSIGRMTIALGLTMAIFLLGAFAAKQGSQLSRLAVFASAGFGFVFLTAVRLPILRLTKWLGGRFFARLLIVDGAVPRATKGFEVVETSRVGLRPDVGDPHMLDYFSALTERYDRVVVSCEPERREDWAIYLKGSGRWGELLIPELHGIAYTGRAAGDPVGVVVSVGPLDMRTRVLKRTLDLVIAIPAVLVLALPMILIAIAIKLDSPGPVFFNQRRMGRGNRLFFVRKFRSMHVAGSDADGSRSASREDDRITRVGRIIRATSLDELPQLLNVIDGDMSLVGPRPHALGSLAGSRLFWQVDARYWLRHAIKPGITGLAQVRGYRGATHREEDLENRLQSDLEYVSNWSLINDLIILARTLLVLVHKNAY